VLSKKQRFTQQVVGVNIDQEEVSKRNELKLLILNVLFITGQVIVARAQDHHTSSCTPLFAHDGLGQRRIIRSQLHNNNIFCDLKRTNKKTFSEFTGTAISDRTSISDKRASF
jgi:hypothetical protein